ncbi:MAG: allantoinase AllB [Thermomicrobiales bacterium]|nr:allantoinase AllB [Thermomicrobiales bacterium]
MSRRPSPPYDVILRGATLVSESTRGVRDVAVRDGTITAVAPQVAGEAREEIEASGLHLLPGVIDLHVHFNDPGRAHWEGWRTGSAAAAVGGTTTVADMPLNASPPTLDAAAFDAKVAAATGQSHVDFALWGGLTPRNLDNLGELAERGVIGFKAFMSNSGIDDFLAADDATLREGMAQAAALGLPAAVHAEDEAMTSRLTAEARAVGATSVQAYLDSRPPEAELAAIARALELAEATGCELYVVHISTAAGVQLVADARARGVAVHAETCPHYLLFTADDLVSQGAAFKCAPPLRTAAEQQALANTVRQGHVDTLASDHSPSPPDMKATEDFFQVWGGVAGGQSLLAATLSSGVVARDDNSLQQAATLLSRHPAQVLRQPQKGDIAVGLDADLVLVDVDRVFSLAESDLRYRHPVSPYVGFPFRGYPVRTFLRGVTIAQDGHVVAPPQGRLLTPARGSDRGGPAST